MREREREREVDLLYCHRRFFPARPAQSVPSKAPRPSSGPLTYLMANTVRQSLDNTKQRRNKRKEGTNRRALLAAISSAGLRGLDRIEQ